MALSNQKWVIFRRSTTVGEEQYFIDFVPNSNGRVGIETTEHAEEARGFATAREAYEFADFYNPNLQNWRVGLRPHRRWDAP